MTISKLSSPENWIDQHGDYLFRYAIFRLREAGAAEDAVQETLLAALQSYNRFNGSSSERTWLVGILKHKIVDLYRRIGRGPEISCVDAAGYEELGVFEKSGEWAGHWLPNCAPTNWQLDAYATLERKEFWETLDRCLGELPKRMATAFILREIDGFSSEEICDLLSLSHSNLWVMLHRARLKLRNSLEAEWFRDCDAGSVNQQLGDARGIRSDLSYRTVAA